MDGLLGDGQVYSESVEDMKRSRCNLKDTKWVAFQNHVMDSEAFGHIIFLAIGPENMIKDVPKHLPDSEHGMGWKYRFVGYINLKTGLIEKVQDE